jgi:hypothetical protein
MWRISQTRYAPFIIITVTSKTAGPPLTCVLAFFIRYYVIRPADSPWPLMPTLIGCVVKAVPIKLPYSVTSQMLPSRISAQKFKGQECDNVRPGQRYCIPQGRVTYEDRAAVWWLSGENRNSETRSCSNATQSQISEEVTWHWPLGSAVRCHLKTAVLSMTLSQYR